MSSGLPNSPPLTLLLLSSEKKDISGHRCPLRIMLAVAMVPRWKIVAEGNAHSAREQRFFLLHSGRSVVGGGGAYHPQSKKKAVRGWRGCRWSPPLLGTRLRLWRRRENGCTTGGCDPPAPTAQIVLRWRCKPSGENALDAATQMNRSANYKMSNREGESGLLKTLARGHQATLVKTRGLS